MQIERKDATVNAADDEFPGTFEVILSNAEVDRDGESLTPDTWKDLPDHIPFDIDHEMSVRGTVGSGKPSFDDKGNLVVKGRFASTTQAQEVRTLIREGHITKTSVAFARDKTGVKDGKPEMRELLNGAFVAIPSNRSADILLAKSAHADGVKIGARNNSTDAKHLQAIHDHAAAMGAACATEDVEDAQDGGADDSEEKAVAALTAALKAAPTNVREAAIKALTADAEAEGSNPVPAVKAATAEGPTAEDIALKARAISLGLNL